MGKTPERTRMTNYRVLVCAILSLTLFSIWTFAGAPVDLIPGVQLIFRSIDLFTLPKSKGKEKWVTQHLTFPSNIKVTTTHARKYPWFRINAK